jgi:2-oxoglutarate ferredoxin oxidoreductase subunit alpha
MDSNQKAVDIGYNYAKEHFACPLPIRLEAMDADEGLHPDRRQHGAALGCVYAGATSRPGIHHAVHVADGRFRGFLQEVPRDPDTKKNLSCIVQAEDELAAIGMVIGAGWAVRARSRPPQARHLADERVHRPGLLRRGAGGVFDVQRTGPSTGMPTRTQQGDLLMCAYASHGDTRHICLYPADPREAFECR